MLNRLSFERLAIDKRCISVLDVYCSDRAKRVLETGIQQSAHIFDKPNFFDGLTQIVIGPLGQTNPILLPCNLLNNFQLLERNEFYGINEDYLPSQVLADIFGVVYMDTEIKLPGPRKGKQQSSKHSFLKSVWHKDQVGDEFQLEFGPEVALDLTRRLRDYLPIELLKGVTSYTKTPSLVEL